MIFLNIGEPDFTAPPLVQEAAAKRAMRDGATQYTNALGLDAAARTYQRLVRKAASGSTFRHGALWSRLAHLPHCTWPAWR
jgi:aspartate/methionine/tyrosine aminotransferase